MAIHTIQESNALLLYKVGPVLVCSPTMPVEAVVMPPKFTVPPGASVAEPGVFKSIHGLVRLVDLRVRFGVNENDFSAPGKIVIVEVEGGHAGFWVDEIEDVIGFPTSGWADVSTHIPRHVFSKTLLQKENIRLYADFEQLDKFKATGYLKKYIEKIKLENNKNTESYVADIDKSNNRKIKKDNIDYSKEKSIGVIEEEKEENLSQNINVVDDRSKKSLDEKENLNASSMTEPKKSNSIKHAIERDNKSISFDKKSKTEKPQNSPFVSRAEAVEHNIVKANDLFEDKVVEKEADIRKKPDTGVFSDQKRKSVAVKKEEIKNKYVSAEPKEERGAEESAPSYNNNIKGNNAKDNNGSRFLWWSGSAMGFVIVIYLLTIILGSEKDKTIVAYDKKRQSTLSININTPAKLFGNEGESLKHNSEVSEVSEVSEDVEASENDRVEKVESVVGVKVNIKEEPIENSGVEISNLEDGVLIVVNDYVESNAFDKVEKNRIKSEKVTNENGRGINRADEYLEVSGLDVVNNNLKKDKEDEQLRDVQKEGAQTQKEELDMSASSLVIVKEKNIDTPKKESKEKEINLTENFEYKNNILRKKKYIHVVVKGDTLWYIAKKYVNNPWRYPELAKLSRIKNPDLIYPGNKVIIILNYRRAEKKH